MSQPKVDPDNENLNVSIDMVGEHLIADFRKKDLDGLKLTIDNLADVIAYTLMEKNKADVMRLQALMTDIYLKTIPSSIEIHNASNNGFEAAFLMAITSLSSVVDAAAGKMDAAGIDLRRVSKIADQKS